MQQQDKIKENMQSCIYQNRHLGMNDFL